MKSTNIITSKINKKSSKKKKILYIFLGLLFLIAIKSTFVFGGPIFGQLIDAKTGEPIINSKVQLKIRACIGGELINVGGCNPDTIYIETVITNKKGEFIFPFKIIFKNPIGVIDSRRLSVNEIDKNNVVYSRELHSSHYGKGPYIHISGGITGYESLDYRIKWIPFSNRKISLVPLVQFMTANDCPENMSEVDRRRCFDHVSIRETQPLAAITQQNGYTWQNLRFKEIIYRYYRTKYFGDCDKPQNYGDGMQTELNCREILKVIKENYPICSVVSEWLTFKSDVQKLPDVSSSIKAECEIYHVGSLEKSGKNPLVPNIISDINICNQFQNNLLKLCQTNYQYPNHYNSSFE